MGNNSSVIPLKKEYSCEVFLGGTCNPTTWRKDVAIPMLLEKKVTFYNPQVENWHSGLIAIEHVQKENAHVLLFVIDKNTRAQASIVEASYYIGQGRNVVLVIENVEANTIIQASEVDDLNRGRKYLKDFADRKCIPTFSTVDESIRYIISTYHNF